MWEGDGASHLYLIVLPDAPHHAAEITETVDRDDGSLLKGRCEKRTGEVRPVMLYEVQLPRFPCHNSLLLEHLAYSRNAHAVSGARGEIQPLVRPQRRPQQLVSQMNLGIA